MYHLFPSPGPTQTEYVLNRSLYKPGTGALNRLNFGSIGSYALATTPTPSNSRNSGLESPAVIAAFSVRTSGWPSNPRTGKVARSGAVLNTEYFIGPV